MIIKHCKACNKVIESSTRTKYCSDYCAKKIARRHYNKREELKKEDLINHKINKVDKLSLSYIAMLAREAGTTYGKFVSSCKKYG